MKLRDLAALAPDVDIEARVDWDEFGDVGMFLSFDLADSVEEIAAVFGIEPLARKRECPFCRAGAGEECVTRAGGKPARYHVGREWDRCVS